MNLPFFRHLSIYVLHHGKRCRSVETSDIHRKRQQAHGDLGQPDTLAERGRGGRGIVDDWPQHWLVARTTATDLQGWLGRVWPGGLHWLLPAGGWVWLTGVVTHSHTAGSLPSGHLMDANMLCSFKRNSLYDEHFSLFSFISFPFLYICRKFNIM